MVVVTIGAKVRDRRRMFNHNLLEREKFDNETVQLELSSRYFQRQTPYTDRGYHLNIRQRQRLLNNQHFLFMEPIPIAVMTPSNILFPLFTSDISSGSVKRVI